MDITAEGIKKLVDDERVELLTVRLCRHGKWLPSA